MFQLGMRSGQMSALRFSQVDALTEQMQHTTQHLQRIVDLVAKRSCQTSGSGQLDLTQRKGTEEVLRSTETCTNSR